METNLTITWVEIRNLLLDTTESKHHASELIAQLDTSIITGEIPHRELFVSEIASCCMNLDPINSAVILKLLCEKSSVFAKAFIDSSSFFPCLLQTKNTFLPDYLLTVLNSTPDFQKCSRRFDLFIVNWCLASFVTNSDLNPVDEYSEAFKLFKKFLIPEITQQLHANYTELISTFGVAPEKTKQLLENCRVFLFNETTEVFYGKLLDAFVTDDFYHLTVIEDHPKLSEKQRQLTRVLLEQFRNLCPEKLTVSGILQGLQMFFDLTQFSMEDLALSLYQLYHDTLFDVTHPEFCVYLELAESLKSPLDADILDEFRLSNDQIHNQVSLEFQETLRKLHETNVLQAFVFSFPTTPQSLKFISSDWFSLGKSSHEKKVSSLHL